LKYETTKTMKELRLKDGRRAILFDLENADRIYSECKRYQSNIQPKSGTIPILLIPELDNQNTIQTVNLGDYVVFGNSKNRNVNKMSAQKVNSGEVNKK